MTDKPLVQVAFLADYGKVYGKGLEISSIVEAALREKFTLNVLCRDCSLRTTSDGSARFRHSILGSAPYRALSLYGRTFAPSFKARLMQERKFDRHVETKIDGDIRVFFGVPRLTKSFQRARNLGMTTVLHAVELAPRYMRDMINQVYGRPNYETNILGGAYVDDSEATLSYVDYVFCHTEFSKKTYIQQGFPEEKIKVFPMGGNHVNQSGQVVRSYPEISLRKLKILYVGNITKAKGSHLLVEAARQLRDMDVELHLCGDTDIDFREDMAKLQSTPPNVFFHGNVDPRPYYAVCDLFVFPTLIDSFGRVVVEAASFGLPCIATEVGAASLVEDRATGLIVEPTVASVVEAIQTARISGVEMAKWSAEISRRAAQMTMDRFGENNLKWLTEIAKK